MTEHSDEIRGAARPFRACGGALRALRGALAAALLAVAPAAMGTGTATIRVTNASSSPLVVAGTTVRAGASTSLTVAAERAGRLAVEPPAGWVVASETAYPSLKPGSTFSMRLSTARADPAAGPAEVVPPGAPRSAAQPATTGAEPAADTEPAAGARPAGEGDVRTFEVPMLWVRHGPVETGGLSRNPFVFRRDRSGRLLRISASEDTPGGSGGMMRASLWLAAATAAMFRNDPMDGVKLEVEYTGRVDGPSAGGVTCLAILCALDGVPFPDDFAMTGTIMPDGTIGLVGGVARKFEGAAAAGAKRVCIPSFCRFETQSDGGLVDLWEKAEALGLELHPVSSLEEAYAVLRGRTPAARPSVPDAEIYRDASGADRALLGLLGPRVEEIKRWEERYEKDEMPGDEAETAFGILESFGNGGVDFDVAFESGMLHVLAEQVADRVAWWRTVGALSSALDELEDRYDDGSAAGLAAWDRDIEERTRKLERAIGAAEARWTADAASGFSVSPLAGQCVEVNYFSRCKTVFLRLDREAPTLSPADIAAENDAYAERVGFLLLRDALCRLFEARFRQIEENARAVASVLPRRDAGPSAANAEEFFHAAQAALKNSLVAEHGERAMGALGARLYEWDLYLRKCSEAEQYHAEAAKLREKKDPGADFATVVSAMAQADALAHGCMAAAMVGNEIGATTDDGGDLAYKNHPFLSFLLRTSRDRAVAALAECDRAGVPCPRVRAHVQSADYHRDEDGCNRFDVIREYWRATLKAKALLMMFPPSGDRR